MNERTSHQGGNDHVRRGATHLAIAGLDVARWLVWLLFAALMLFGAVIVGTLVVGALGP